LARLAPLVGDEVGFIPFDPEAASFSFALTSSRYERALVERLEQHHLQRLDRDLRRTGSLSRRRSTG
jgi:hypothetical protein